LNDAAFRGADSAFFCKDQHGMLDLREVPPIIRAVEFGDPQPLIIFDDRLGPRGLKNQACRSASMLAGFSSIPMFPLSLNFLPRKFGREGARFPLT
jgi:hypothetical protein